MLLVRQRVQDLAPIEVMEVLKCHLLVQVDAERLLFQAMQYSEEFNSFVLKHPATPNQLLCNYVIWYTESLDHPNQDHGSGEALGVKRKHNITGVRGGKHCRQRLDTSSFRSEQVLDPTVIPAKASIISSSLKESPISELS
jgi:hypothetical protein